jgi:lipopolysaccharide export system protein LptA
LTCDRINFIKKENRIDAVGRFKYKDTLEQVELTGDKGTYWTNTKFFKLTGSPKLIRMEKAASETLTISSKTMSYLDSLKTAYAEDEVVISKGKLRARCQKAIYHTEENIAYLRIKPDAMYDIHTIIGDSIDLYFSKEALKSAFVLGNANAFYIDTSVKSEDTAFTKIWGDTIYMSVSDSGNLDTIKIIGKALSTYYLASKPDAINKAEGKKITMFFNKNSNLDRIKICGNAKSLYYVEDVSNSGVNEASGDSIIVYFSKGKASSLTFAGSVRGRFYPEVF